MGLLLLTRLIFLVANYPDVKASDLREVLLAFFIGFRFDLATALITITVPLLPLWLPSPPVIRKFLHRTSSILTVIFLIVTAAFLWGDLFFYVEANRHLTLEPFGIVTDYRSMSRMLIEDYLFPFIILVGCWIGLAWWVLRIFRKAREVEPVSGGWGWERAILWLPIAAFTLIGARGGIQKEPLKSADAVIGANPFVANVAMNGWYSFLTEASKSQRSIAILPENEAVSIVRNLVRRDDDRFLEADSLPAEMRYPLLRISPSTGSIARTGEKLNVVVIVVESLNAEFLQTFGGSESVMPFLDSLARESVTFTNFQSVGTRSFRGLCALLASYPNLGSDSYSLTFMLPRLTGLGGILAKQGYDTRFLHGAPINSMGITAICRMSGYESFISLEDFPKSADNGSWGAWDHIALQKMQNDMDQMKEPFHYGMFTLCTHAPWSLPKGYSPRFAKDHPRAEVLNTYSYLDDALRDFFIQESYKERFSHTLYTIVGDHTTHASESERFRIACMFYAPGRLQPHVETGLASQLDFLPSIIDLVGIETEHSSFGASLFGMHRRPEWAVLLQSSLLYWREGNRLLESGLTKEFGLFDPLDSRSEPRNYLTEENELAAAMNRKLVALYQVAEMLPRENRFIGPTQHKP